MCLVTSHTQPVPASSLFGPTRPGFCLGQPAPPTAIRTQDGVRLRESDPIFTIFTRLESR